MTAVEDTPTKEKLIEFIHNLTDEECEIIIKALKEKEQP